MQIYGSGWPYWRCQLHQKTLNTKRPIRKPNTLSSNEDLWHKYAHHNTRHTYAHTHTHRWRRRSYCTSNGPPAQGAARHSRSHRGSCCELDSQGFPSRGMSAPARLVRVLVQLSCVACVPCVHACDPRMCVHAVIQGCAFMISKDVLLYLWSKDVRSCLWSKDVRSCYPRMCYYTYDLRMCVHACDPRMCVHVIQECVIIFMIQGCVVLLVIQGCAFM